ncbi:MAG: glycoside hydrolase family 16 protein [Actinomycetota bacterium]|nr:glycoside hydrolase family 16 protein [Actinomycetota bacterium]
MTGVADRLRARPLKIAAMLLLGASALVTVGAAAGLDRDDEGPAALPDGRLAFVDEFDGDTLDRSVWATCYRWALLSDLAGCTNAPNGEEQWYLDEQVHVTDGAVHLVAEDEPVEGVAPDGTATTFDYRSALITTDRGFHFRYGYVEIEARVPFDAGLWPALWLLPSDGSWPPEIDILEVFGRRDGLLGFTFHGESGDKPEHRTTISGLDDVHTYGLLWLPDRIQWFVDGEQVFEVLDDIPDHSMFLVANLAVGGDHTTEVDERTEFPASVEIDSVRVWTR